MAILVSPGVDVSVIDESVYATSGPGTVPLIVVATGANKASVTGTGVSPGTIPGTGNSLYSVTSQRELVQLFGNPTFYQDQGSVIQGYELNEYGLLAAYQYLGISNAAYVLRADVDLNALFPRVSEPRGEALSGTYWLDTQATAWGTFQSNGNVVPGLAWQKKPPLLIDTVAETETYLLSSIGFASLASTPITVNGVLQINGVNVNLLTTDSLSNIVAKINAASIPNVVASTLMISNQYFLFLRNTISGDLSLAVSFGSPILVDLGFANVIDFTAPKQTLGLEGDLGVVTISNDNVIYQKITPKDFLGQNIIGATPFWFVVGSDAWRAATPTVMFGALNAQNYTPGDDITISDGTNSVTVTFTNGTSPNMPPISVNQAVTDINTAISALPLNLRPTIVASNPTPTQLVLTNIRGGDIIVTDLGNRVASVNITNTGTGYTSLPTVTFSGGGGVGAASQTIFGITGTAMARRGGGYSVGDLLSAVGGTATSSATLTVAATENYFAVDNLVVNNPGTGYPGSSIFTFKVAGALVGLQDTEIEIQLTTDFTGAVNSATVINPGYIFAPPPNPISITDADLVQLTGPSWPGGGSLFAMDINLAPLVRLDQVALSSGGSGYVVGDVLTVTGGTFNYPAKITVTAVDTSGIILNNGWVLSDVGEYLQFTPGLDAPTGGTGVGAAFNIVSVATLTGSIKSENISSSGQYTVLPVNPVALVGGTGKNASFNATASIIDSGTKLGSVGVPGIFDPGFNWTVGDFLEAQGGVRSQATRLRVLSVNSYNRFTTSYTVLAQGTGYVVGDIVSVGGGAGAPAQLLVTSVGGSGEITGSEIWFGGNYTVAPTATVSGAVINTPGAGYSNGVFNCTVVGGTFTSAATLQVTVAGGVVTGVSVLTPGAYTVAPNNPVTVTGLTSGSGASFTLTFSATGVSGGTGVGAAVFGPIQTVSGGISNVEVINAGRYSVLPAPLGSGNEGLNVPMQAVAGLGQAAKFDFVYGVSQIIPTAGGDGYTSPPFVSIIGGGGGGATADAVLGTNTQTLISLGISNRRGNRLFYSPHFNVPTNSVTGDIWIKTTTPTNGANWSVKIYSRFTQQWSLLSAPLYSSDDNASLALGTSVGAGTLYVYYNVYGTQANPIASHVIKRWRGTGPLLVTGSVISPTTVPGDQFQMRFLDQNNVSRTVNITLTGVDVNQAVIDVNNAMSGLGITNITASNASGQLRLTNSRGLTLTLVNVLGTPLNAFGISELTHSNWEDLVYEAGPTAPTTPPVAGTLWYNSVLNTPDILVNDGNEWRGYRNTYPLTDPNGPQLQSSPPTVQSTGAPLVENDLWINTSLDALDAYPALFRWSSSEQSWLPVDTTDQSTPFGIVFADARATANGQVNGSTRIQDMLVSDYLDPDAGNPVKDDAVFVDPRTYPTGMLLFNTRYSNFNVKQWQPTWFSEFIDQEYSVGDATFPAGTITAANQGRWVTISGNQLNGAPYMGRLAQRQVIVEALASAIITNDDIRAEDVFYNLIAVPGYPELLGTMRDLNVDKREIAFIIGDTPARLAPSATSIINWLRNTGGGTNNNEQGFVGPQYTYSAIYYPWGLSLDTNGNQVMVPPSHMMLRTIAYNDQVAYPWFAPAGFTRGLVQNATQVGYLNSEGEFTPVVLNQGQRDVMYAGLTENRAAINPISNQPGRGLVVFGQKTLHPVSSALDRVNVARLICYLRYNFDIIAKPFLFEPNDKETRDQAKLTFENFLNNLISLRAIDDYAVQCDEGNNTPDRIDRNELWIDVAIVPLKAIEFIYIPIRIRNTGEI